MLGGPGRYWEIKDVGSTVTEQSRRPELCWRMLEPLLSLTISCLTVYMGTSHWLKRPGGNF